MAPKKDYEDYTKFVNDELSHRKYLFQFISRDMLVNGHAAYADNANGSLNTLRT
jgi:hypothetical protein